MSNPKYLHDRVVDALWARFQSTSAAISAADALFSPDRDFAIVERDRVLTPEDERVLEALKADMEAERSAYAPAHSFPDTWKKVLAAISANPRLAPPAPKLPVWTVAEVPYTSMGLKHDNEPVTDWNISRNDLFVARVISRSHTEAKADRDALADARDGAGKWVQS